MKLRIGENPLTKPLNYLILHNVGYAKEHEPCIIFMDEIDAIGGRRFSEGTSADREIQRTLMEVCIEYRG